MASTRPVAPLGRSERHVERDSWAPTLGPGMVLGALGTIGLVVSLFMSWRSPGTHPSEIPLAFLFDSGTKATDPSLLLILVPMAILLGVGTALPRASAARLVGALGTIVVVTLFAIQLDDQIDALPGAHLGDLLDTGFYVAAISAVVGLVSGFLPSGWSRRRSIRTESAADGIDFQNPRV